MRAWIPAATAAIAFGTITLACGSLDPQADALSGDDDSFASGGSGNYFASGTGGSSPVLLSGADGADGAEADDPSTATYEAVGTNPFVITAFDPLSTFAADVDTASYDIFRREAGAGTLPDPASVRLEEYVNYFDYGYEAPAADAEVPFNVHLGAAPGLFEPETVMLRVGIQGREAQPAAEKRPANLVFLVDISGSMSSSEKLPLVQLTLYETLGVLNPDDTVSIVTYAGSTGVALPPTPVSDRSTIETVIESFAAGGSTAGASGIDLAYAQAEAAYLDGGINHVILCTDGDFNVGPSSTEELVTLIEEKRRSGITLTVLGFGAGNDAMMEAISNKGNGVYGVMTDADSVTRYVEERMLSTMDFIAKDLKIQVEFNPEEVYAYRLLGYENRAIDDVLFRDDTIDAGEIGAGHSVTALYELVLAGNDLPTAEGAPDPEDGDVYTGDVEIDPADLALVKIRYKDVDATEADPALEVNASLAPEDVAASEAEQDAAFQWATAIASLAEILKASPYADPGRLDLIEAIVARPVFDGDPDKEELETLLATIADQL
jgi:Ca-activated chloride channel family protein